MIPQTTRGALYTAILPMLQGWMEEVGKPQAIIDALAEDIASMLIDDGVVTEAPVALVDPERLAEELYYLTCDAYRAGITWPQWKKTQGWKVQKTQALQLIDTGIFKEASK